MDNFNDNSLNGNNYMSGNDSLNKHNYIMLFLDKDVHEICAILNVAYVGNELDATFPREKIILDNICIRNKSLSGNMQTWIDGDKVLSVCEDPKLVNDAYVIVQWFLNMSL